MHRPTLRQRLRYRFDNAMASGTKAMVVWLTMATATLILVISVLVALSRMQANGNTLGFGEALWQSMLRAMDSGTMGADTGAGYRAASLFITLGGVLVVSSLIGLLANGIAEKAAELKRGRSPVLERDHTLILGWSGKIYPIISELSIANENQHRPGVVVLGPLEKDVMEERLEARVPDRRGTRVVCRTGTPFEPVDLAIARPEAARSIIVLNRGTEDGDAEVVKTTLALLRVVEPSAGVPIVVEIQDASIASSLADGTSDQVTVVRSANIIARVTAQVSRQPGLSGVYQDLFDFDGDEIYFHETPELVGRPFRDALRAFEQASPLGLRKADGAILLNPEVGTVIETGDAIIAIAEDDDRINFTGIVDTPDPTFDGERSSPAAPEATLLIGWNEIAPQIIKELDSYVSAGSSLLISVDRALVDPDSLPLPEGLSNLSCEIHDRQLTRESLHEIVEELHFDHVIVLCYRGELTEAQADARVLLALLHLRSAISAAGTTTNIVAELLDERDVDLTPDPEAHEFIVSERLTALLMAQLSENRELAPVFEDLLDAGGAEIYLKSALLYGTDPQPTFASVVGAAAARGEIAIGHQHIVGGHPQVVINPPKSATVPCGPGDLIIVLADEEG